jgi:putative heme-binding domain-containing protein
MTTGSDNAVPRLIFTGGMPAANEDVVMDFRVALAISLALFLVPANLPAQSLDEELRQSPVGELVQAARTAGDAARGAVVFFQPHMACAKCHVAGKAEPPTLGPDLTAIGSQVTDEALVESLLLPSKVIRQGYQSVTVVTADGQSVTGLLSEQTPDQLVLRDVARGGEPATFDKRELDDWKLNETSIMPAGQANALHSRQQFLDLIRYLIEIRDGGAVRALQLQPPASLLTFTVPEYEQHIDHAGLIGDWDADAFERGEAIYQRVCANCHGTLDKPGSLPTSLRFAEGKFKNGGDPLSMYRTLTHGFGLMAPQTWMVPSQKYDVIHYIRETYLQGRNPSQFVAVDAAYLAKLPPGDTRGPEPSQILAWSAMDYGPSLAHTFEVPGLTHNLAYKGIAMRLDPGAGGVSRGRHWMLFDTDTLRVAAAWNGTGQKDENFIDWHGIQFDGEHGVHPRLVGKTAFANSTAPGWADPSSGRFADDQRVLGRDGRRYGPLPRDWGRFRGLFHHGQDVVLSYSVGTTDVLEWPRLIVRDQPNLSPLIARTFNVGPRDRDLLLQVAEHPAENAQLSRPNASGAVVRFAPPSAAAAEETRRLTFDGNTYLEIPGGDRFDLTTKDFTILARIKTRADGTIWSLCQPGPKWTPDGQTFFVRGGRLAFDIGWVGAVSGKTKIDDDHWHTVAMTWQQRNQRVRLYVDGRLDGEGQLAARGVLPRSVTRIGFTTPDFPRPATFFQGAIAEVRFYQSRLDMGLGDLEQLAADEPALQGRWLLSDVVGVKAADTTRHERTAEVRRGMAPANHLTQPLVAGFAPSNVPAEWTAAQGRLQLRLPAGRQPLRFTLWLPAEATAPTEADARTAAIGLSNPPIPEADRDLTPLTQGGPPRWPQKLETQVIAGAEDGPFAADILTAPETNPWLAQTRFTGLDFLADGRIAVCTWDGDVWLVEAVDAANQTAAPQTLRWQRIASGMFQPLGLKIVKEKIHVICRDQLTVLHDLNGDGEIDFYECLNNDHQVTEHFHEFAMGLQTDADGNFYYAKSGCHGKAAVVPHHGTLLRISPDGSRTDILANGFRAANGVCLNPDGSFVVTDQEGFWNPKNRINWVTLNPDGRPNFYGNMLGYHDVTDTSDEAMIPPLCWITNAFDRSPAELLWVTSDRWGPLQGSLLNLSYGYGKVFLVPHEQVGDRMQGGMIELPIPAFPTGVMRGRFHPQDGQLYLCGMFAWAGNATQPGGLYRLRATGRLLHLPVELHATRSGLTLTFTEPLDPAALDVKNLQVKTWSLKRTANYGSKHFDERTATIRGTTLSADAKTLTIDIADLRPTWCMEIVYSLRSATGAPVQGTIHNTIHTVGR